MHAWAFFLAGLIAPGCSQILFTLSIREAGASRTSVAVGDGAAVRASRSRSSSSTSRSRCRSSLGALAIVGGGVALAAERDRPGHLRLRGPASSRSARRCCFAVRDNLVRALHAHASPETAAAATLLAGALVALAVRASPADRGASCAASRRPGVLFGLSYLCLFEAYFHGRVSVVSPLVATECLWGVGLSALRARRQRGSRAATRARRGAGRRRRRADRRLALTRPDGTGRRPDQRTSRAESRREIVSAVRVVVLLPGGGVIAIIL